MRLNEFEIAAIRTLAKQHFGNEVHVFLFGSRTDDRKRGGDIDLYISHPDTRQLNVVHKINFLTDLVLKIGDQKIDVVLEHPVSENSVFVHTIHETSVQLC
ncbi:MAG TPA: nucleotidyltransferase domain-containing protein [Prolixibacteraceae bacterium]|nr:nucleotidyltransferase domain-containing protein [Prolixibacteraceae bacterium]